MAGMVGNVSVKLKPHALAFSALWNEWMSQFMLRAFLWFEFWTSGLDKLPPGDKSLFFMDVIDHLMDGDSSIMRRFLENNWFSKVSSHFPGPIKMLPDDFTWLIVMFSELIFSWMLLVGLGTRFAAICLFLLTAIAWYSVHAHYGYNVCDNGWKMPLVYLIMLTVIIVQGPSKLTFDRFIDYWMAGSKK
ncbi:MAG: DoxX family protein [Pseudomonadota bacterium]